MSCNRYVRTREGRRIRTSDIRFISSGPSRLSYLFELVSCSILMMERYQLIMGVYLFIRVCYQMDKK
jgi:hypothetical protein